MTNTLVSPTDLAAFPGAPFSDAVVDAIAATLQTTLGWHVAPRVVETITLDHLGGPHVVLPSRMVNTITEIRDVTGTPTPITGWRQSAEGGLLHGSFWPVGLSVLEVDLDHGYDALPEELLPVLADLGQSAKLNKTVTQQAAQPFTVVYASVAEVAGAWVATHRAVLAKYTARTL